jgi:hypothetical protein
MSHTMPSWNQTKLLAYHDQIARKVEEDFQRIEVMSIGEQPMPFEQKIRVEEALQMGHELSSRAHLKRLGKMSASSPAMVQHLFREFASEAELLYKDAWTKKLLGQAKNWLSELARSDRPLRETVNDICLNWEYFQSKQIKDGERFFPKIVSFEVYYRNRRVLDQLLLDQIPARSSVSRDREADVVKL